MTIDKTKPRLQVPRKVRSIAIIGGGPSGAITLDTLVKQNSFEKITVLERSDSVGGCWNIDEDNHGKPKVNPTVVFEKLDPPVDIPKGLNLESSVRVPKSEQYRFDESPGYKGLRTNVPQQLMCFSDEPTWGISESEAIEKDYCYAPVVKSYIERYFNRHQDAGHLLLNTSVEEVYKDYNDPEAKFILTLRETTKETNEKGERLDLWSQQEFDAVIIATGHYNVPYFPKDTPGIAEVFDKFPEKIVHSKYFKPNIDKYEKETVIVVGGKISAFDIVTALSKTSKLVYNSKREASEVKQANEGFENIIEKPVITKYEVNSDQVLVHFSDGSTVLNPDRILFATGYYSSYPFMTKNFPNFSLGHCLPHLYNHTFSTVDPLISVIGLPTRAVTFKVFEHQAIYVSAFLAGKLTLPSPETQLLWCKDRYREHGNSATYHSFVNEKFEWTRQLIKDSGDYYDGVNGKKYYEFTEEDEALHREVLRRYAEEVYFFLDPTKMYF